MLYFFFFFSQLFLMGRAPRASIFFFLPEKVFGGFVRELIFLSCVSSSKHYVPQSLRYRVAMNNRRYAIRTMVVSHAGEVQKTPSENLLRSSSHARPACLHCSLLFCLRFLSG